MLNTLQDADEADWRSIMFIDNALLNKIALWLTKQQDKQTGAFIEEAPFYDYNMRVNLEFIFFEILTEIDKKLYKKCHALF